MLASLLEASTLVLLLFVAVPLKHMADRPVASSIIGPVHGLAYLYYMWTVFDTVTDGGWTRKEILRLVMMAFVPFGGFLNAGFLRRKAAGLCDPHDRVDFHERRPRSLITTLGKFFHGF